MIRFDAMGMSKPCTRLAATAVVAFAAVHAAAAVSWHETLGAAKSASQASHKPVLAVFTAPWAESESELTSRTLAQPEVEALLTACFEPVHLELDAHPELVRNLGITHVPTACVLAVDGRRLAAFECPLEPAAFAAALGRAAQQAATAEAESHAAASVAALAKLGEEAADLETAGAFTGPKPAPGMRGSISLLTAKVRQLTNFADGDTAHSEHALTTTHDGAVAAASTSTATVAVADNPQLPAAPPAWESPRPTTSVSQLPAQQATRRLVIEPAQATAALPAATPTTTPWLNSTASTPAGVDPPESSATISDAPVTTAPKSATESFMAALQKPFSIFSRKPAAATQPPAPPVTMPPAQPTSPMASVAAVPQAAAEPDTMGSMPLGLEGYCPVTLAQKSIWMEGRAQWGVRHRGRTYLFAGGEQQAAFLADPDRYAPALSGDDPVLAFEAGKSTAGRRSYGVTYQSRIYLFCSPETRAKFTATPERYVARVEVAERRAPAAAGTRTF
jgi:YHS domain-containing protein